MQVRLIKELYGNQIRELYHSLPYHMIELVLDDSDWSVSCINIVCLEPFFFKVLVALKIFLPFQFNQL